MTPIPPAEPHDPFSLDGAQAPERTPPPAPQDSPAEASPAAVAPEPPQDDLALPPWAPLAAGIAIAAATLAAYSNTFRCPFMFDDENSIVGNTSIRNLRAIHQVLAPPGGIGETVGGRPLLNLSLALNYAVSGMHVWSYHLANLIIHALAALTLFGIVRRTLRSLEGKGDPVLPALAIALLWVLHPIHTESVTYIVQRAESLCGLFYLLTFYCFIRAVERPPGLTWYVLSGAACLAAVTTKEVAATVPLLVFLYDRTFVAKGFLAALERRYVYYLGLAASWIVLALLIAGTGWNRGNTIGFSGTGVSWHKYALSQFHAYARYLELTFWPHALCIDYGTQWAKGWHDWLPGAVLVAVLLGGTLWALVRKPAVGFLGAWFFVILAPSSSIIPGNRQTLAEHRMYLSLAAVITLVVLVVRSRVRGKEAAVTVAALAATVAAAMFGATTWVRNFDYESLVRIFQNNVDGAPDNPFAHSNYGHGLALVERYPEAESEFLEALRIKPDYATAWYNLGTVYSTENKVSEAINCYRKSLSIDVNNPLAHSNLGNLYMRTGETTKAKEEFEDAVALAPGFAEAHYNLGNALSDLHRRKDAVREYAFAISAKPDFVEAHNNLGVVLSDLGRARDALEQFLTAIQFNPNYLDAHINLARAFTAMGRRDDAMNEYEIILRLAPNLTKAREALDKLRKSPVSLGPTPASALASPPPALAPASPSPGTLPPPRTP